MRKSSIFFIYLCINLTIFCLLFINAWYAKEKNRVILKEKAEMARRLELTDLALFTEARYTRHLSQADLNTPFQDSPLSLEHFPSGSIIMPPAHIKGQGSWVKGQENELANELYR